MTNDKAMPAPALLLTIATLLPLLGFVILVFWGKRVLGNPYAGYVGTAMIGLSFVLSMLALIAWLRAISDAPPVLYCDGRIQPKDRQAVAIVGARKATSYGLRITETLAQELSGAGSASRDPTSSGRGRNRWRSTNKPLGDTASALDTR